MKTVLMLCVAFGAARLLVPARGLDSADLFKDAAHLFVGSLFGAATVSTLLGGPWTRRLWFYAVGLTLLEGAAAAFK